VGGTPTDVGDVLEFHTTVEGCGLRELEVAGPTFTWDNGVGFIQECIDLVFINDKWMEMFPSAKADHLDRCSSDHVSIKVVFNSEDVEEPSHIHHPYRFKAMWVGDDSCFEVIRNAWLNSGSSHADSSVLGKVARCAVDLKE
ncbi:LOW QUALITY PROTEIN: hypothetical protein V2J09_017947, partial [Rumex salicifolius]